MVEQDDSQASPVFPDILNGNGKQQNSVHDAWFVNESTNSIKEESLSCPVWNDDCIETSTNVVPEMLPKKEITCDDSSYNEQYCKVQGTTDLDGWWQPLPEMCSSISDLYFEVNSPVSFWGNCPLDLETMKIDDVFQVDKDDLVQSPTLAELNANDESLFDSFDCFDDCLPTGEKPTSNKSDVDSEYKISPFNIIDQPKQMSAESSNLEKELSLKADPSGIKQDLSPVSAELYVSPKSSLKNTKLQTAFKSIKRKSDRSCKSLQNKRAKTVIDEDSILSVKSVTKKNNKAFRIPHSSLKTDDFDSGEDSEGDGDYSSDADEESDDDVKIPSSKYLSASRINLEKKRSRYFWQYNMQSKGPKGPKMKLTSKSSNVHDLPGVADPVFSANCPIEGVKHSGKARRGDGNDLTPNPKKLYSIGIELEKLNHLIDGLVPVNELPINARIKSRKEKNKLASRACRLKKKAQHEANKLKLFGLQQEQKYLLKVIGEAKKLIKNRVLNFKKPKEHSIVAAMESLQMKKGVTKVAGCSADFVNDVLKNVASGDENGGLNIPLMHEK